MSSARRYRKALKVIRQRREDETWTRFAALAFGVCVFEAVAFLWITGAFRVLG